MDLEQSSTAYHICSITSCLLLLLEDILLKTLLPIITVVVPTLIALTYLLIAHQKLNKTVKMANQTKAED